MLRLRLLYLDRHDRLCVGSPSCRATSHTSQVLDVLLPTSHGEYFALTPHLLASRRIEARPMATAPDEVRARVARRLSRLYSPGNAQPGLSCGQTSECRSK
jgi:hypothetical protein